WAVYREGLSYKLGSLRFYFRFPPRYDTENGAAFEEVVGEDGCVNDPRRVAYLCEHLRAASRAIAAGVPLKGYFVWSLLDNFEWSFGYTKRFGIVHVDFDTLERTPKASAEYYRKVIRANAVVE